MKNCPLCRSFDIQDEESVSSEAVCKIHTKGLGVDPSYLFANVPSLTLCVCKKCKIGFYYPLIGGDSHYYSLMGKVEWYYEHEGKSEFEYAAKYIQKGQTVLDVGAGVGRFGRYLSDIEYLGIELADHAILEAQRNGINVIKKDLFELAEERKGSFDVVASFQVIEHVSNPKEFIEAMKNLLKPGGLLILAAPNNDSRLFKAENMSLNSPPHHLLLWNQSSLEWIANELKMEIKNIYLENVQKVHLEWFHRTIFKIFMSKIFRFKLRKFETSFFEKNRNKFITLSGRICSKLGLFVKSSSKEPGHSILMVFKKN